LLNYLGSINRTLHKTDFTIIFCRGRIYPTRDGFDESNPYVLIDKRDACPTGKKIHPALFTRNRGSQKNKVGSLAIMAIIANNYFRPITLRPILSDSLPFSTFHRYIIFFSAYIIPKLEGF